MAKLYRVKLRRSDVFKVKPNAELIDGKVFWFGPAWVIEEGDTSLPIVGETAMYPIRREGYPRLAPAWVASGDLELTGDDNERS